MIDNANTMLLKGQSIAAERITGVNDNMLTSHYHEFYELYYLESGQRSHLINDSLYWVDPGQFVLFEPYVLHRSYGDSNIPFCRLLVYFRKEELFSKEMEEALVGSTGVYQLPFRENQQLYQLMNMIYSEQQTAERFGNEYCRSLLNTLLIILFRNKREKRKQAQKNHVTEVISYININYAEPLTLEILAKQFYISPYHLCREFKFYTNSTVIQYINTIRIIKAQQMLCSTDKSITEISGEVGFASLTHFGRVFKSVTSMSPSVFRKKNVFSVNG